MKRVCSVLETTGSNHYALRRRVVCACGRFAHECEDAAVTAVAVWVWANFRRIENSSVRSRPLNGDSGHWFHKTAAGRFHDGGTYG